MTKPTIEPTTDGYKLTWPEGIEAGVERLAERHDEISAELTIWSARPPRPGLLHQARINLMSSQTRKVLAGHLDQRCHDDHLDWGGMLEQLCFLVVDRHRRGEPAVDMRGYQRTRSERWHVHPFLEHGGPTVLFGDGGSGKSTLATAIALTAAGGHAILGLPVSAPAPVIYLDYETGADTFHERAQAICAGVGVPIPPLYYRRQYAALAEAAPVLRREIAELGVGTAVIDSVGLACGGDPQAADVVLAFFRAVDLLRVPTLVIDHIAKGPLTDQGKAFGSVYKHNRPRLSWRLDRADGEDGPAILALSAYKHNDVRRPSRLGYRLTYTTGPQDSLDSIEIGHADLATQFPAKATMRERITATLAARPMTRPELSETLAVGRRSLDSRVSEMIRSGALTADEAGKLWIREVKN